MDNIIEALNYIDVARLSYQEWINVGMGLKSEGYDCSVWDRWSSNDSRYKSGECERSLRREVLKCIIFLSVRRRIE